MRLSFVRFLLLANAHVHIERKLWLALRLLDQLLLHRYDSW